MADCEVIQGSFVQLVDREHLHLGCVHLLTVGEIWSCATNTTVVSDPCATATMPPPGHSAVGTCVVPAIGHLHHPCTQLPSTVLATRARVVIEIALLTTTKRARMRFLSNKNTYRRGCPHVFLHEHKHTLADRWLGIWIKIKGTVSTKKNSRIFAGNCYNKCLQTLQDHASFYHKSQIISKLCKRMAFSCACA